MTIRAHSQKRKDIKIEKYKNSTPVDQAEPLFVKALEITVKTLHFFVEPDFQN